MYGFGNMMTFVVSDPELIKKIMIKDFDSFVNRDHIENNAIMDKYLGCSVLQLRDQKWKDMRTLLSPIYTTSKLKMMFKLMTESAAEFKTILTEKAHSNNDVVEVDTYEIFARVTVDGITTTSLGFKSDCVAGKDPEVLKVAEELSAGFANIPKLMLFMVFPKIYEMLGLQLFTKNVHDFFDITVMDEFKRRMESTTSRPDVVQLLIAAKKGQLKHDDENENDSKNIKSSASKVQWSDEELIAQILIFLFGGFETTTNTLQSLFYELVMNPEVQETLISEIDGTLEKLDGESISYEELHHMKYLDMVINETARVRPSIKVLSRYCNRDYILEDDETGKSWEFRKGTLIYIPFAAMCQDEKNFENPQKFDPTRFSDENKKKIPNNVTLSFGLGPRMCIGSRFALTEIKLVVFTILSIFKVEKNAKTPEKLTLKNAPTGYNEDILLDFKLRN